MNSDQDPLEAPSPGTPSPAVVGIGASAGGLEALRRFFDGIPTDSGMAFVVVVHLSPEHESHLAALLQPHSRIPIRQVDQTVVLEADHGYVIPPNANLGAIDTHLRVEPLEEDRRERAPIDHFFRTLSRTHDGDAIGIVLTGTGSDGALGLKAIKERGGLTLVQDPDEAQYPGMPSAAVATGIVDLVIGLAEIPEALIRLVQSRPDIAESLGAEDTDRGRRRLLEGVFTRLRTLTGRNFSRYKSATILRRIARRMQLRQIDELPEYLAVLAEDAEEAWRLADDLLVVVTEFFRDPDVFRALEEDVIPRIFDGRGPDDDVRAWTVGCATGEEAYSIAILLLEEAARREAPPHVQVFATDLHESSVERARAGIYPGDIRSDVEPKRLSRYFNEVEGGYRIRAEVRQSVVFAPHNLLADPPFSHVDLVSCRNLLIYLRRGAQRDAAKLFHYALRPGGYLLLGTSEAVEDGDLFTVEDKAKCLYRKRDDFELSDTPLPLVPITHLRRASDDAGEAPRAPRAPRSAARNYGALHQRMLEWYGPPSLLLSPDDAVVHVSRSCGRYLLQPGGELTDSALKLVRPELRGELGALIRAVRASGEPQRSRPITVRFNGESSRVTLSGRTSPSGAGPGGFVLVLFDEIGGTRSGAPVAVPDPDDQEMIDDLHTVHLEGELEESRQRLRDVIDEYETGEEKMQVANEELLSANEELRSTMEELETSKEELQSMNEELQTVNQENRHKVAELAQLSDDLQNFLAATDIPTLFLDRDLRIMRFTPRVADLYNVRRTDRGRPLSDLTHRLGYAALPSDAKRVLSDLAPIEREVRDAGGRWYLTRIRPYKSGRDEIEGVVITFVDISRRKRAEAELRHSEEFHRRAVEAARVGTWDLDLSTGDGVVSAQMARLMGYSPERRTISLSEWLSAVHPDDLRGLKRAFVAARKSNDTLEVDFRLVLENGEIRWLHSMGGLMGGVTAEELDDLRLRGATIDATELKEAQEARRETEEELRELNLSLEEGLKLRTSQVREQEERFRRLVESAADVTWTTDPEGNPEADSPTWRAFTGQSKEEYFTGGITAAVHPDDRNGAIEDWERAIEGETSLQGEYRILHEPSEEYRWMAIRAVCLPDEHGDTRGWFGMNLDIDDLKRAEERIRDMAARLTFAEQEERRRLATLLHDDLQQVLYAVQMRLGVAYEEGQRGDRELLLEHAARSIEMLEAAVATTRHLTVDLSPPVLDGESLAEAIQWVQTQMREMHGLAVTVTGDTDIDIEAPDVRILLFQTVRELLFNVAKHAETGEASVDLHADQETVTVCVSDHGCGFDLAEAEKHASEHRGFGLFSARERLGLRGGSLEIDSAPGEGTRVVASVPRYSSAVGSSASPSRSGSDM